MILTIEHGEVHELRLNRPPVNALSAELITALRQAIVAASRGNVRALILSGCREDFPVDSTFLPCCGWIVQRWQTCGESSMGYCKQLRQSPIPIATAITGHAPAGGTVLSIFADWRVMAQGDYKIGLNEVQVGIQMPPGDPGSATQTDRSTTSRAYGSGR